MRPRLAPRASRTAISFCRAVARAISRLATLAQAISSTPPTMPSSSHSGCDSCWRIGDRPCAAGNRSTCPFRNCSRVYAVVLLKSAASTSCSRMPWKNGCSAALAWSRVTPGFNRPKTFTQRLRRFSTSSQFGVICAFIISGTRMFGT